MYSRKFGIHGMISAVFAVAMFGISALVLDRAYLFSAPDGVVEVGQPTPIEALDEIIVIAAPVGSLRPAQATAGFLGNGLKVKAIRNAPIPRPNETMKSHE